MKIMMFCSNPVNGGTARMFYELVNSLREEVNSSHTIEACIDINNTVEIYNKIDRLSRLDIHSEQELFADKYRKGVFKRVIYYLYRKIRYFPHKKKNISVMKKYLMDNQIDCVVVHNGGYVGDDLCNQMISASYKCGKYVKRRICVFHNDMKKSKIMKFRYRGYDKKISHESTDIITVSQYTKKRIEESSYLSKNIKVIYNGINVINKLKLEKKKEKIRLDKNKKNILMIGNFQDNKGQYQFIQAAELLYSKDDNYSFTIIGNIYDQLYYSRCKKLIDKLCLNQCFNIYHGINNASEYIELFDLLVVPSMYDESFGLISVEAMANGKPVVAFACGGIPEVVVDRQDGFIVPLGNVQILAEKIRWLENHLEERNEMGRQALVDYEQKFCVKAMIHRYMELLQI